VTSIPLKPTFKDEMMETADTYVRARIDARTKVLATDAL